MKNQNKILPAPEESLLKPAASRHLAIMLLVSLLLAIVLMLFGVAVAHAKPVDKLSACKNIQVVNTKQGEIIADSSDDYQLIGLSTNEQRQAANKRLAGHQYTVVNTDGQCLVKIKGIKE